MGWSYEQGAGKEKVVSDLLASFNSVNLDGTPTGRRVVTLKHSLRGNHLWMLKGVYSTTTGELLETCIDLALLQSFNGNWGYKGMDETVHPYYYDCPMAFLNASEPPTDLARQWREKVKEYHAEKKAERNRKKNCVPGATIYFKEGYRIGNAPAIRATVYQVSGSKIYAHCGGGIFRVYPRMIAKVEQPSSSV